jgi:hypothetical protein
MPTNRRLMEGRGGANNIVSLLFRDRENWWASCSLYIDSVHSNLDIGGVLMGMLLRNPHNSLKYIFF